MIDGILREVIEWLVDRAATCFAWFRPMPIQKMFLETRRQRFCCPAFPCKMKLIWMSQPRDRWPNEVEKQDLTGLTDDGKQQWWSELLHALNHNLRFFSYCCQADAWKPRIFMTQWYRCCIFGRRTLNKTGSIHPRQDLKEICIPNLSKLCPHTHLRQLIHYSSHTYIV